MRKIIKSVTATALLCLMLAGFGHFGCAHAQSDSKNDKITLIYNNGTEKTYTLDEMRSAIKGTVVLLRDSCMDDAAGCDMTVVYNAMDFAFLKGAMKASIPLTTAQYNTIQNVWLKNDFFEQLYPTVEQDIFRAVPASDGRYTISFGFNVNARVEDQNAYDKAMRTKFMSARDKALEIVSRMPRSCNTDYKKVEYLYDYMTSRVIYYSFDLHGNQYYNSGDVVCLLYDALIRHETVCAGFAYTFAYLCELAGIDAQYVTTWTGSESDPSHEVVIAEVDGKNYWFDATWDCGNYQTGFQYFGLSDQQFEKKHTYNKTYYSRRFYPSCKSSLENPTGYWDFDTNTYRSFAAGISTGRYSITTALNSGKVLEVDGYSKYNGGNVQIYDNGFIDFQKFDIIRDADGYAFRNCGSSLMMDVQGGAAYSGTNVWQYESEWILLHQVQPGRAVSGSCREQYRQLYECPGSELYGKR